MEAAPPASPALARGFLTAEPAWKPTLVTGAKLRCLGPWHYRTVWSLSCQRGWADPNVGRTGWILNANSISVCNSWLEFCVEKDCEARRWGCSVMSAMNTGPLIHIFHIVSISVLRLQKVFVMIGVHAGLSTESS